ncbi:lysoplasmalogenase [Chitinophaga sp. MM2321]|uniref:lysoplasmalogenase n=1 Tax=Chitinophaga sp. MM2321 TaxID=3137178 RepID=UPI0032D58439
MLKSKWLILYFVTLLADLTLIGLQMDAYRYTTKPLLMLILAIYFFQAEITIPKGHRSLMLAALLFSFLGDVLLMFDHLFLPGLGSFLVAHLFYIAFFLKIRFSGTPRPLCKWGLVILNAAVIIGFILFMFPHLGSMTIPIIIYSIVISITLQSVLHAFRFTIHPAGWYCLAGAILFICSDAMIAIGKFYHPITAGGIWVMLTYGIAQWGLVYGSVRYFQERIAHQ